MNMVKKSSFKKLVMCFGLGSLLISPVFSTEIWAQQVEERTLEIGVASKGAEARQEAFQKAIQMVSREMAERRLGAEFLRDNEKRFNSEVLSKSSKYILSVKGGASRATDTGTVIPVILAISGDAFDSVLRQTGLAQLSRQRLKVVVLLDEQERAVKEGPWWAQSQLSTPSKDLQSVQIRLVQELKRRGLEVIETKKTFQNLPAELKKPNLSREELVQIGTSQGAALVLFGLVAPKSQTQVIYHVQWIQVAGQKMLAEVQGEAKAVPETVDRFLAPVVQAQAAGTLNAKPIVLTIRGDLNPAQLKLFKEELLGRVPDIRSLKERLFSRGEYSFEAVSPQSPSSLVSTIQAQSFKDFQLRASQGSEDEILLSVKKR